MKKKAKLPFYAIEGDQGGRTVIRDLDRDGKPEIIVGDLNGGGGVSIFRNNSTKTDIIFNTNPVLPFAVFDLFPVGVAGVDVADLNGDGLPDLVASNGGQDIHAFTNASTPGDLKFSSVTSVKSSEIQNLKLGDMDGDERIDMVVSTKKHVGVFQEYDRQRRSFLRARS